MKIDDHRHTSAKPVLVQELTFHPTWPPAQVSKGFKELKRARPSNVDALSPLLLCGREFTRSAREASTSDAQVDGGIGTHVLQPSGAGATDSYDVDLRAVPHGTHACPPS